MNPPLQTVLIGAGYFAQFHIDAWQRLDDVHLSAIVEVNEQHHKALRQRYPGITILSSLEALTQPPDIVDIVSPPTTHAQQIQLAFEQTSALVICQKPFCDTLELATQAVADAARRQRTVVVHENFRFQPWYRTLKSLLQQSLIGEVQQAAFRLRPGDGQGSQAYLERQPYFQEMPRFLIHETGVHFIDVFRYLFGEPEAVTADLRRLNPHIRGEDAGYFTLRYRNGLRALFDGNRHLDHPAANNRLTMGEMLIEGTAGTLSLDGDGKILHRQFGARQSSEITYARRDAGFGADCVFLLQQHVVNHLLFGSPLENHAADYLQNLKLEALVYQCDESGCTLPVT